MHPICTPRLQRYLQRSMQHTTVVVVSHDRAFLNAVAQVGSSGTLVTWSPHAGPLVLTTVPFTIPALCWHPPSHAIRPACPPQEIIVFKKRQLAYYTGNYDEYEQQVTAACRTQRSILVAAQRWIQRNAERGVPCLPPFCLGTPLCLASSCSRVSLQQSSSRLTGLVCRLRRSSCTCSG